MAGCCRRRGSTSGSCAKWRLPLIEIALDATGGNQAKCADLLGINRNTLRKKITDLDIRVTRRRKLM
jgi:two-component system nitrogen regulation response regulator GlnG